MRIRAACDIGLVCSSCLAATPARAQYGAKPMSDPATGESYHVEVGGYLWYPTPDIVITSEALGIVGSQIDFVSDLGIEKTTFKQLKIVLRPGQKHKLRFEYTPDHLRRGGHAQGRTSSSTASTIRSLCRSRPNLQWKAYRFAYEYDFVYTRPRILRVVLEAKYTRRTGDALERASTPSSSRRAAPIPTIGAIGRVYVAPNISITGELSGLGCRQLVRRRLPGALLRLRSVRHRQLQRPRRRAGGISLVRRLLQRRSRRGGAEAERAVLRWGRRF